MREEVADWAAVDRLVREWRPEALVVGDPRSIGDDGRQSDFSQPSRQRARRFAREAAKRYAVAVWMVDELCSELAAEAQEIWGRCIGCPPLSARDELIAYLLHNQIDTTFFASAYPEAFRPGLAVASSPEGAGGQGLRASRAAAAAGPLPGCGNRKGSGMQTCADDPARTWPDDRLGPIDSLPRRGLRRSQRSWHRIRRSSKPPPRPCS